MKNAVIAAIVALVIGVAAGYGISMLSGGPKVQQVVAAAPDGSLDQTIKDLDAQLAKVEEQFKQIKRTPKLEDQAYTFNLEGAAGEGPENAKLTLVVFSDFECPFCSRFAGAAKMIRTQFPNDVRIVFMNFPLDNACNSAMSRPFHQRACMGAMAAAYAQENGKFWEMHDWLFANQSTYSPDTIATKAQEMGLDPVAIKDAIATNKYQAMIEAQASQMLPTGSRGTPTIFINGKKATNVRWDDPNSVTDFLNSLLNPQAETVAKLEPTVKNPGELPSAQVVLPDGVTLEARLKDLSARIGALQLPTGPGPQPDQPKPRRPDPSQVYSFDNSKSPGIGPENAKVTLVVFSDFLCPHCYRMAGKLEELRKQFPNDLRVVFKNVPGHQGSPDAHEAAMEAYAQGKFWEMHNLIWENREKLNPEVLAQLAQQAGLNMEQYNAAISDHRHRDELKRDLMEADKASVAGTPTVFLNGRYMQNSDPAVMATVIKTMIEGGAPTAPAPPSAGAPAAPPAPPGGGN